MDKEIIAKKTENSEHIRLELILCMYMRCDVSMHIKVCIIICVC